MLTKHYGIIVGIDGSAASDSAVGWAAHEAATRGEGLRPDACRKPRRSDNGRRRQSVRRPVIVALPSR
jgi:nucleotide-binding universal stress UspA family protein